MVQAVDDFFNAHKVPWSWFITPASYEHDLLEQGLILTEKTVGMYFNLLHKLPMMQSHSIHIKEIDKNDDLQVWIEPINEAFQEDDDDSYRKLNAGTLRQSPQKFRHFVAYYNNELAASGTLFVSHEAVMIHNLATKNDFKRKGLGTAMVLHMLKMAKEAGYVHCYLDASEEGILLYQKIGFKQCYKTLIYEKPKLMAED